MSPCRGTSYDPAPVSTPELRSQPAKAPRRGAGGFVQPLVAGLAVADPANSFSQDEMLDLLGLRGNEFAETIFGRCGVERRHLELSPKKLGESLQARTPETELQLLDLARVRRRPARLRPGADQHRDQLELLLARRPDARTPAGRALRAHPDTDKYHVLGIGCASAVPLFKMARQALNEAPDSGVLVVAAESVSGFLTGVEPDDERTKIVGNALFGDGCAAALLTAAGANGSSGRSCVRRWSTRSPARSAP